MRTITPLISRIPFYQSFRAFDFPKLLPINYTFLISTKCNSGCLTCNIWKKKGNDLKLEEWKKVFQSLDSSPFWVTISGGEPFLQNHLADLVIAVDRICQPAIINIPTNSLLPEQIAQGVVKILKNSNVPNLIVNLSLDGVGRLHDKIRGVPGNFVKVMENYQNLKKIKGKYKNLHLGLGTVISAYNVDKLDPLFDLVFQLQPDQYVTEIAEERAELGNVGLPITPSIRQYSRVIDSLNRRMKHHRFPGIGRISQAFRGEYYRFVQDWLAQKKLLPDYAGFASCEITNEGEVWPSCIKAENMGNLRKVNYDFPQIWFSHQADRIRQDIKKRGTSYPLANAFYSSALCHWPTLARVAWRILFP